MPLEVFRNSEQGAGFVLCVVTVPICILTTFLRFVATRRARKIGLEDGFALVSLIFFLIFFLIFTLMFLYLLVELNGRSLQELALLPPSKLRKILKIGWAMSPQFCANQLFAKLSLFLLYYRIFWVDEMFVRWLYILGIVQILWFVAVYLVKWFMCSPVEYTFDKTVPDGTCINITAFLATIQSVNSLVDFAMIGLAIWLVQAMKMGKATKCKRSILFALGGLSGIIGFIKIGEAYNAAYNHILSPIWDIVQMATSIICCCAPIWKPLFINLPYIQTLRSTFRSYFGSGSGQNSTTSPRRSRWTARKGNSKPIGPDLMEIDGSSHGELV